MSAISGNWKPNYGDIPAMTIDQLFEKYWQDYAQFRCKTGGKMRANFTRYFAEIKDRLVTDLPPYAVQAWHNALASRHGHPTANRSLTLLRTLYNFGDKWSLISCRNPAKAIRKFSEEPRSRFVTDAEMPRLLAAIDEHGTVRTKDIFLMCLFTAQRIQNVCAMRWEDIDFVQCVWRIPASKFKTGRSHEVPLVEEALTILRQRGYNNHEFVFPGVGPRAGSHIAYPYNGWRKVLKKAGIKNLRPHDLRRTHATIQNENGETMPVIAGTLGHQDLQSTRVYTIPKQRLVRAAMQGAVRRMVAQ